MSRPIETHSALVNRSRSIRGPFVVVFSGITPPGTRKKVVPEAALGRDDVLQVLKSRFESGLGPAMILLPNEK